MEIVYTKMYSFIHVKNLVVDEECKKRLEMMYQRWMRHEFDLLGSGWVKIDYDLEPEGFRGEKYNTDRMRQYGKMKKIFSGQKDGDYREINWFVDYKSGFFFHPLWFHSKEKCGEMIGKQKGVDIKCPWELGRLYHLVPFAVYAYVAEKNVCKKIVREFYNEIIDFIRSNPVGRTVQWSAPMDVSIRIVNILIAFDILKQIDRQSVLDDRFEQCLMKHIEKSGKYVIHNLEYSGAVGSNHYLSNIVGLLFAAAYLPSSKETDAWLVFAVQELIEQVKIQFHEEGSNFEGSTSYHRLSTEFVLYATALVYGVLRSKRREVFSKFQNSKIDRLNKFEKQKYRVESPLFFPQWYLDRLCNAGKFTCSILKSNNEIVQIGDNDSGRLVKLTPVGTIHTDAGCYLEENVLDHRTLLSAVSGLFDNEIFEKYGEELPLEKSLIKEISHGVRIQGKLMDASVNFASGIKGKEYCYQKESSIFKEMDESCRTTLLENGKIEYYPKFGIVVFASDRVFLSFVIDTLRYARFYGHAHNDKMSIEVMVDGIYITRDPGGYIYTADSQMRDRFRSTMAHNCIHAGGKEQNIFTTTFGMKKNAKGDLLYCDTNTIIGKAVYSNVEHVRKIQLLPHEIIITDYANQPFDVSFTNKFASIGYGKLMMDKGNENEAGEAYYCR